MLSSAGRVGSGEVVRDLRAGGSVGWAVASQAVAACGHSPSFCPGPRLTLAVLGWGLCEGGTVHSVAKFQPLEQLVPTQGVLEHVFPMAIMQVPARCLCLSACDHACGMHPSTLISTQSPHWHRCISFETAYLAPSSLHSMGCTTASMGRLSARSVFALECLGVL